MQRFVIVSDYGGPVSDEQVPRYLYRLFSDPRILDMPGILRTPLAKFIATMRTRKARAIYRSIGGSPVNKTVSELCKTLNREQRNLHFVPGFQYIEPLLFRVAQGLAMTGTGDILVLPTFPHDSFSTYGSARDAVDGLPNVRVSCPYYDDDTFLDLLEDSIRRTLDDWTPGDTVILCTAHSIPVSYVEKGDAYVDQVKRQVGALRQRLSGFRLELAFQSPIGPVKWVGPFLEEKLKDIADDGTRQVVVMPLSFTVDNSETCYELDMEVRELAGTMGIDGYRRVPCLNNDPGFRAFLLKKAEQELGRSNEQDKTVEAT